MKIIVAGGRKFQNYDMVKRALDSVKSQITEIVSGNAAGADHLGEKYAKEKGIDLIIMPANWTRDGKAGGYIRNEKMAQYADALIAFWDGKSSGTEHMINLAKKHSLKVKVIQYNES